MSALFATIITAVVHTPIWVWALYALLLFLGFQRTRDGSLPLWRVLILPLVVTVLALWSAVGAGLGALPAVLLGLVIGGTAGWLFERDGASRRLPNNRLWLRGEWWSFAQLVLILILRYAINVVAAMNPGLNADPIWHFGTLFLAAMLSAAFLGRTAARLRVYFLAAPAKAG